jgi:drug/metabolite transporter (DMT)-like permease
LAIVGGKKKSTSSTSSSSTALLEKKGGKGVVVAGGAGGELVGEEEEEKPDNSIYKAMLLVVALLWGSNFGALKYLDTCGVDVSLLTAMRFALASGALLPFLWGKGMPVFKAGLEVGLWVTLGYITQAIGLETTEASKSAFICSLTVVVVPLIQGLLGKKIPPTTWAACALAVFGVGLLTLQGATGPVIGDLWSLGQPVGFGIAFMRIEHYMKQLPGKAIPLAAAQMVSVFGISAVWAALTTQGFTNTGDLSILFDTPHFLSLLYTGLISSALAVVIESAALEHVSSEETSVIFSTEPLFAAATSAVVLGERLKPTGILGGAAILSACLLTQVDVTALATVLPMLGKAADVTEQVNE